jgi:Insertion element 4 transposase N-terminal/Transposase DDE domain
VSAGVVSGATGRLTDHVAVGVLTSTVPRQVVDAAIALHERRELRCRKLPAHVMVYFAMAMCLFPDDDYEEVATKLTGALAFVQGGRNGWQVPTSGALTQARARLGFEPVKEVFDRVAGPIAQPSTPGAYLGPWHLMAIDGFTVDVPDTPANRAEFDPASIGGTPAPYPKVRVVALSECASRAMVAADVAGCWAAEQTLAFSLYARLTSQMLLTADRGFYSFDAWREARSTGAQLLWRLSASVGLPAGPSLPDGSYLSALIAPKVGRGKRSRLTEAARAGQILDQDDAVTVRVIEYEVPDRTGSGSDELICLITTILDADLAPAALLAAAYHQRWEAETGNDQLKTHLRGPGRVLRSRSPEMVYQEIWAYLLTHYAISALICKAATAAEVDPDRVKFLRTVRIVRRSVTEAAAFPP